MAGSCSGGVGGMEARPHWEHGGREGGRVAGRSSLCQRTIGEQEGPAHRPLVHILALAVLPPLSGPRVMDHAMLQLSHDL